MGKVANAKFEVSTAKYPWETTILRVGIYEIMWSANLKQQGVFIDVFLARRVSGTYVHHQEH